MISENARYWVMITEALGYCTPKVKRLYELYPDISVFINGGKREWRFSGLLSENEMIKLEQNSEQAAERILNRCRELKYSVISIDDLKFPKCLLNIYNPPAILYVDGVLPDLDNRMSIGIVGTRTATLYGKGNSYKIAYALSKYGVAVVSGGALGVDCASHRGALAAGGVTVCVRGCGINSSYLRDNYDMRRAIANRGAVISEYPPDEEPKRFYFPARNRIIAALSDGVLIIEAGKKSGSLITANLALEMGKEVFALLGNNSPQNEGSNSRIKEGSAIPVTDFLDIILAFDNVYATGEDVNFDDISLADIEAIPVKGKSPSLKRPKSFNGLSESEKNINGLSDEPKKEPVHKKDENLTGDIKKIYEYISDTPVHIDKLSEALEIPVFKVLTALTKLEMNGLVTALQGRRYILKQQED